MVATTMVAVVAATMVAVVTATMVAEPHTCSFTMLSRWTLSAMTVVVAMVADSVAAEDVGTMHPFVEASSIHTNNKIGTCKRTNNREEDEVILLATVTDSKSVEKYANQ